ncbi:GNAT family N-acetyltransferase [Woodsholea maritima]|uniref:GNAT family N-acetyltransferase n=1 Tax=Woodsholea maritima TaxID=240237 RepID=UPI00036DE4E6|nr:GNAT family N-acetyltransferase [Woodsholea maritima]
MRYFNVSIQDLKTRDLALWQEYAAPNGQLISPYLTPDFAQAVARVRTDCRVLLLEDQQKPVGFLPFHAPARGIVRPIAAPMSDYQGLVAKPGLTLDPEAALSHMKASAMVFNNWTGPIPSGVRQRAGSAVIDLSKGAQCYFAAQSARFKDHFKKMARRLRKAEAEFGPMRVELGDATGTAFQTLKAWKSRQYQMSGKLDLFAIEWVDQLLSDLASRRFGTLKGIVASLYFGDTVAAVEFGIAAGDVYHSWFPAYNPQFAKVSPGLLLLHGLIETVGRQGITRIDLGKGDCAYKKYYTSYEMPLMEGRMLAPGLAAARIYGMELAQDMCDHLPGVVSKGVKKLRGRWAHTAAFERRLDRRFQLMGAAMAAQLSAKS